MSLQRRKVLEGLRALLQRDGIVTGEVTAVDETAYTCTLKLANEVEIGGMRLNAVLEPEKGIILVPKVGSYATALALGGDEYLVIAVEEVERIVANTVSEITVNAGGTVKLNCEADIIINGGGNKGIPVLDKIQSNLDELKGFVLAMHDAIPAAFNAVGAGSSANGGTGKSKYETDTLGKTISFTNMENPKVKH